MLKFFRKKYEINTEELDTFLGNNSTSNKYYLEKTFKTNKLIKYLVFLRIKGVNMNTLFDKVIKEDYQDYKDPKKCQDPPN